VHFQIKDIVDHFVFYSIVHVHYEANQVAGGFAKLGLNLPSQCRIIQDMYSLYLKIILHLYSLTFSAKMLGEKMKREYGKQ
jgi:hypothetical protein